MRATASRAEGRCHGRRQGKKRPNAKSYAAIETDHRTAGESKCRTREARRNGNRLLYLAVEERPVSWEKYGDLIALRVAVEPAEVHEHGLRSSDHPVVKSRVEGLLA